MEESEGLHTIPIEANLETTNRNKLFKMMRTLLPARWSCSWLLMHGLYHEAHVIRSKRRDPSERRFILLGLLRFSGECIGQI